LNTIRTRLYAFQDHLTQIAAILSATGLSLIVIFYVYEVVTRYFFNSPTAWVSDFVSYALCACVFLALPKVTKDRAHVAVTILVDIAPTWIADIVFKVVSLIGFGCLMLAAWISLQENLRQFTKGIETLAIIPVPQWWISGFITFGLALSALYMLRQVSEPHKTDSGAFLGSAE